MGEQPDIIDLSGLGEGDPAALERVARDLESPCAEWGAFQVVGHGIPEQALGRFDRAMRRLFELPLEVKRTAERSRENARGYYDQELTKNRPDWKEVFDYGAEGDLDASVGASPGTSHSDGSNQWPEGLDPELRAALLDHYRASERVGRALLRALCVSLGLAPGTLDPPFERASSFVRLNRYVRCDEAAPEDAPLFPERGRLGVHHHTDAGALTVLYQDEVPGLQVLKDERFVIVEPVAGALTINLGDMLQVWSNDRYRSPVHRVLANAERTRHSAPFFLNPSYDTICAPLADLVAARRPAQFRPVSWAHFRDQRSAGDYADYGAEIQIDDFRVA